MEEKIEKTIYTIQHQYKKVNDWAYSALGDAFSSYGSVRDHDFHGHVFYDDQMAYNALKEIKKDNPEHNFRVVKVHFLTEIIETFQITP